MEAHRASVGKLAQIMAGMLLDALAQKLMEMAGVDRLTVLHLCIGLVRRGGPGGRTGWVQVRFLPGYVVLSLLLSVVGTVFIDMHIRLFD